MDVSEVRESKKELESKILGLIKDFERKTQSHVDSIEIESVRMYSVSIELGNHHEYDSPINIKIKASI